MKLMQNSTKNVLSIQMSLVRFAGGGPVLHKLSRIDTISD